MLATDCTQEIQNRTRHIENAVQTNKELEKKLGRTNAALADSVELLLLMYLK